MNLLAQLYFLLLLVGKLIWCKPATTPFINLIDTASLKGLIRDKNNNQKVLDFRPSREKEFSGYIQGSILVPDSLTIENVHKNSYATQQELFFDENQDRDKNIIFVSNKDKLDETYQKLGALGYAVQKGSIKGYIEGMDAWLAVGGDIEFPRIINFHALQDSLESDSTLLIDVRNRTELNFPGQIPKSVCVPLHEILNGAFQLSNINFKKRHGFEKPIKSNVFVLMCRSGKRILVAEKYLKGLGYEDVRIYPGGFKDWVAHGGRRIGNFSID